jgi:hypothetical protein
MSSSIYNIFANLQRSENNQNDCFSVAPLPFNPNHKVGVSLQGFPMFFVRSKNTTHALDVNLELISILFAKNCNLIEPNQEPQQDIYAIIFLKTEDTDFQQYFLEIVSIILEQLPDVPTHNQLKFEINKLVELFSRFTRPPQKTIQGLWAELFIIEQANHPEYLIQAWHASSEDKFDFNDAQDKIEVKSTSKPYRIHSFSLEQLNPNRASNLLIASVFVVQTGRGKNIIDLINSIFHRVHNLQLQFRLNEILSQTIGNDFNKIFDVYFDYQQAIDTLQFFDFRDIPTINKDLLQKEISNVRFDCDLSQLPTIKDKKFDIYRPLFKSIKI